MENRVLKYNGIVPLCEFIRKHNYLHHQFERAWHTCPDFSGNNARFLFSPLHIKHYTKGIKSSVEINFEE
jgi:hypothetical protein